MRSLEEYIKEFKRLADIDSEFRTSTDITDESLVLT